MSKTDREKIVEWVARSRDYDVNTVTFSQYGAVTAKKDPNKTMDYDEGLYLLGYIDDIIRDYIQN